MGSTSRPDPALTRHIRRDIPLDELVSAAEAVRALAEQPGWPVLLSLLDEEIATVEAELDGRLLDSRAAYARAHGRLSGLRAAPALMAALIDRAETRIEEQRRKHERAGETALEVA
jgi:hypothetical protein